MFFLLFFTLSICSQTVITIDNVEIPDSLFFEKYPKEEWNGYDDTHKMRVIEDFIRRKVYAREALELKLHHDPDTRIKIKNQKNRLLVNYSYEEFVAKPLVTDQLINLTKEYLRKEVMVHHILIGYDGSRLQKKVNRDKDDALKLALRVKDEFLAGKDFESLALQYSDDKSVTSNNGKLGWIKWGQTVHDFQLAAFSLKTNELSSPVLTDFGYHLIYVSEIRDTGFDSSDPNSLKTIQRVARRCVNSDLYKAAEAYDIKMIADHNVVFHEENLLLIMDEISAASKKNKITGNPNVDLVSVLGQLEDLNVVAIIDGKGYGPKWFAEKIAQSPASRRPTIQDIDALRLSFRTIILQEIALNNSIAHHLESSPEFLSMFDDYETAILYDAFRKYVEDNISEIDSAKVIEYYEKNKASQYKEGEKVSIRDLNVSSKSLADSLYGLIQNGADFISLAEKFSQVNPESGGKIEPFQEGRYDVMGKQAFSMDIGEISEPFEKLNRSWSIIKLEGRLPEDYTPVEKVYNKIHSILLREKKSLIKDKTFNDLKNKYHVSVAPEFFIYPVESEESSTIGNE